MSSTARATLAHQIWFWSKPCSESPAWNTRDFNLQVSTDGATWTTVKQVAGNTDSVTVHDLTAAGRYVRLNVITPSSNGNPAARIYEVEVYGAL